MTAECGRKADPIRGDIPDFHGFPRGPPRLSAEISTVFHGDLQGDFDGAKH